jgi:hypothetical protein
MLDTVVITMNSWDFHIVDHQIFSPSTIGLFEPPYYKLGSRANFSCYQNPTKEEFKNGNYKPRLTVNKRMKKGGFTITLKIEFSAPKLLYGNNFDELKSTDFDAIIKTLLTKLKQMGVETNYEKLASAEISAIHYSKNIALTDYTSSSMVIDELAKQNLNKMLDLEKTSFRNEGYAIKCHANSYEVTFYDKIKDLQQSKISEKRALEKDNLTQLDMFKDTQIKKPFEVLRMEVRLGKRQKLKQILKAVDEPEKMTFDLLFSEQLSQKILLHFWNQINDSLYIASISENEPEKILEVLLNNPDKNYTISKALQIAGALAIINKTGVRGFRAVVEKNISNKRTAQRIIKELRETKIAENKRFKAISNIETALKEFVPLKLKNFMEDNKIRLGVDMTKHRCHFPSTLPTL